MSRGTGSLRVPSQGRSRLFLKSFSAFFSRLNVDPTRVETKKADKPQNSSKHVTFLILITLL